MNSEYVSIPRALVLALPIRVREHPERSAQARVTLVREVLVQLAVHHAPILAELRQLVQAPLLVDACNICTRAADKAAEGLGLTHRRSLLTNEDGPLPIRHDPGDIFALAQLEPTLLEGWAVATATLYVALERTTSTAMTRLRVAIGRIEPLAPLVEWLVPALVRRLHVNVYAVLFGPFQIGDRIEEGVLPEWEDAAVAETPGPSRAPLDRAQERGSEGTLAYQAKAWWAVRIEREAIQEVVRRWHATMQPQGAANKHVDDCGCRTTVQRGIKEVDCLLRVRE